MVNYWKKKHNKYLLILSQKQERKYLLKKKKIKEFIFKKKILKI